MMLVLAMVWVACHILPTPRPPCDPDPDLELSFGRPVLFAMDLDDVSCVRQVRGDLYLGVAGPAVLPNLEVVSGGIQSADTVTSIDLPNLQYAGTVSSGPSTPTVSLPALKVARHVRFNGSPVLREIDLSGLERVDDLLVVSRNPELETLDLSRLETVSFMVQIDDNPKLAVGPRTLPSLRRVDRLEIGDNANAVTCEGPLREWSETLQPTRRSRGQVDVMLGGVVCQEAVLQDARSLEGEPGQGDR